MSLARTYGEKLLKGGRLWLFLDYDGTLAPFAPNPDTILPDPDLIALLNRLAVFPDHLRVVILSGRRLEHIQTLLPIPGILRAGTYGIEFQTWDGDLIRLLDFDHERPFLDQVKAHWQKLVGEREDFYIEDKGFSLALHGRRASDKDARSMLNEATTYAGQAAERGTFRILGGYKFLEIAPTIADKGQSLGALLKRFPWPGAEMVYFGDDDKDEEAFKVILMHAGCPILVAEQDRPTLAKMRLNSPDEVRRWLGELAGVLELGLTPTSQDQPKG